MWTGNYRHDELVAEPDLLLPIGALGDLLPASVGRTRKWALSDEGPAASEMVAALKTIAGHQDAAFAESGCWCH